MKNSKLIEVMIVESISMNILDVQAVGDYPHHYIIQMNKGKFTNVIENRSSGRARDHKTRALKQKKIQ